MSTLYHAECLTHLKGMAERSIDSLVTDPPAGISFCGSAWDSDKGGRDEWIKWLTEVMTECLRVMKPGAHGLVWAIPRTSHWTATALENAGFEIRDVVTHLFGTGFPKNLDISEAIDKAAGAEREVVGRSQYADRNPHGHQTGSGMGKIIMNAEVTSPSTDLAKQWQGWGTALKPASENWILVRKPCSEKTVAKNVEKWGTGGINIDQSRIATTDTLSIGTGKSKTFAQASSGENPGHQHPQGRFPANLILDEVAAELLDEQSGDRGISRGSSRGGKRAVTFGMGAQDIPLGFGDSGGASRFFYCAKASRSERGEGNNHPTVKSLKLMRYLCRLITPPNGLVLDPFAGSGSTGVAAKQEGFRFLGIEQSEEYFAIAQRRMND